VHDSFVANLHRQLELLLDTAGAVERFMRDPDHGQPIVALPEHEHYKSAPPDPGYLCCWSKLMERTLIIFKPDCLQRRLVGEILARFERKGLQLIGLKLITVDRQLAERHYAEHRERPFFASLVSFITASPVIVMALEGPRAVSVARKLMGATFGYDAAPGTIRGDFGCSKSFNLIHGSDSPEAAQRELALYFNPGELHTWQPVDTSWVLHQDDLAS
jgi:nucleoside-diphosphate kinase